MRLCSSSVTQPVLNTFTRQAEATVIIGYDGGSVEATTEHPFWVEDRGWVPAAQLQPGDALSGRQGITCTVTALATRTGQQTVYNLEIAEFHTYHVAVGQLLVHNGCGIPAIRKVKKYEFHLDGQGRTTRVKGKLRLDASHKRDFQKQRDAGGIYRTAEDDGGHLIGHIFGGPADGINLVAQRANLNRGAGSQWRAMERQWKAALKAGQKVEVDMEIVYPPPPSESLRPAMFKVKYWIDGNFFDPEFPNPL